MACPRCDFHIHTKYLRCANETMEVAAIVRECKRIGVRTLAITDHLNTWDQVDLHRLIRADIEALDTDIEVYFGVELNFTGKDEGFVFDAETKAKCGFQFAIGGIHSAYMTAYDPKELVDIQHRHHLKTCADPLVQVLVHPYWFPKHEFDASGWPWAEWLPHVPEAFARELGQASAETGTAIEINAKANLSNPLFPEDFAQQYIDYLAVIAQEGAVFSVGSDAHDIGHLEAIEASWQAVETLGVPEERIWRPTAEPMNRR